MPIGAGKYDDVCTVAREATQGDATLLIVLNGNKGDGFACQIMAKNPLQAVLMQSALAEILEHTAKQIREVNDLREKLN